MYNHSVTHNSLVICGPVFALIAILWPVPGIREALIFNIILKSNFIKGYYDARIWSWSYLEKADAIRCCKGGCIESGLRRYLAPRGDSLRAKRTLLLKSPSRGWRAVRDSSSSAWVIFHWPKFEAPKLSHMTSHFGQNRRLAAIGGRSNLRTQVTTHF